MTLIAAHPTCLVFDFDYTLAHFINGYDGLFTIYLRRGIPAETIASVYETVRSHGFSFTAFTTKLKQIVGTIPNEAPIETEAEQWLKDSLTLYPDSQYYLPRWRKKMPVELLTFGDPVFQKKKVEMVGLDDYPLHAVATPEQKTGEIKGIIKRHGLPIVMIDDTPSLLDEIRDRFTQSQVVTILIKRPDNRFRGTPRYTHPEITSLAHLTWHS